MKSVPNKPSSSPMIANMKSVCASGRLPHFCLLPPRPTPKIPPLASPKRLCAGCHPSFLYCAGSKGLRKTLQRAARYCVVAIKKPTVMAAVAVSVPTRRNGIPETKSNPPRIAMRTEAVPRSRPHMTRALATIKPGAMSANTLIRIKPAFRRDAKSCEAHKISRNFASSLGWTSTTLSEIQFWFPLTDFPIPGTRTISKSTIEMINPNLARSFQRSSERRERKIAIGMEMTKKMSWRINIATDEPLVSSE